MNENTDRPTPPRQTPEDPNVADRRLSERQKRDMKNEPAPPKHDRNEAEMPEPHEVGEAG